MNARDTHSSATAMLVPMPCKHCQPPGEEELRNHQNLSVNLVSL